jgi:hypothetical protein
MLHICGVSKTFGEWYQKTNKTEDTNKLTLLAFKIIIILHNTRLAEILTSYIYIYISYPVAQLCVSTLLATRLP